MGRVAPKRESHARIADRRHAEDRLRESEARLRAIVETAVDAIVTIDERGIIESVNPATERLFGYTAAELIGRNVNALMPNPYHEEHDQYLRNYLRTGRAKIIGIGREVIGLKKDGSTFPVDLAVSEVRLGDGSKRFTGMLRDLSERRRLEREILEVSGKEQRRIGQDLHDGLCQQLAAISFACGTLERKLEAAGLTESKYVHGITEMVDETITQARSLAHGLHPVKFEGGGLHSALRQLADRVREMFHVSCTFVCPAKPKIKDTAVATHLYRIAQEAISNAIKHGKAKNVEIRMSETNGSIALTISDDGIGLPAPGTQRSGGMGLNIMKYRASIIGALFDIRSRGDERKSGGTIVSCVMHGGASPKTGAVRNGKQSKEADPKTRSGPKGGVSRSSRKESNDAVARSPRRR